MIILSGAIRVFRVFRGKQFGGRPYGEARSVLRGKQFGTNLNSRLGSSGPAPSPPGLPRAPGPR